MNTITIVLASFAVLAISMTGPAFAEDEWFPYDVEAIVTGVEREHGTFVDKLTFTVEVTNYHYETVPTNLGFLGTETDYYSNECLLVDGIKIRAGQTKTLTGCYTIDESEHPDYLNVVGWTGVSRSSILPFMHDGCDWVSDDTHCLPFQNIDHLIEDIEPNVQCVTPPPTDTPTIGSAAYHTYMNDIILTFNTPVTLADGWQDGMSILATNGTDSIRLDGLESTTRNLMSDDSTLVWLSLSFRDYTQVDDATELKLSIDPLNILYGDGHSLNTRLNIPIQLVP